MTSASKTDRTLSHLASALRERLRELRLFLSVRHRTHGVVILRTALGLNTLVMYALHFPQRAFIWGDNGVLPRDVNGMFLSLRQSYSVYQLGSSDKLHALVFFIGIVVTALFTFGFAPRAMSVLFFVFTFSRYSRNEIVLDGGNNLLVLVAFMLMFADLRGKPRPGNVARAAWDPFLALIHNFAVLAIILQLCILYFTSAWAKMMGHMWQDGTAIYYILRTSEFNLSPLTPLLIHNDVLVTLLVYGTIVLQVGFPFVIWHKTLKYPWIVGAFTFHLAIAYFLGLVWFSLTMLSCEFILIDDSAYEWVSSRARFLALRLGARKLPLLSPEAQQAVP